MVCRWLGASASLVERRIGSDNPSLKLPRSGPIAPLPTFPPLSLKGGPPPGPPRWPWEWVGGGGGRRPRWGGRGAGLGGGVVWPVPPFGWRMARRRAGRTLTALVPSPAFLHSMRKKNRRSAPSVATWNAKRG